MTEFFPSIRATKTGVTVSPRSYMNVCNREPLLTSSYATHWHSSHDSFTYPPSFSLSLSLSVSLHTRIRRPRFDRGVVTARQRDRQRERKRKEPSAPWGRVVQKMYMNPLRASRPARLCFSAVEQRRPPLTSCLQRAVALLCASASMEEMARVWMCSHRMWVMSRYVTL